MRLEIGRVIDGCRCGVTLVLAGILSASVGAQTQTQTQTVGERAESTRTTVLRDLRYLAGAPLKGRATGSAGNDSARVYLTRRFREMQIDPAFRTSRCDPTGACEYSYVQSFQVPPAVLRLAGIDTGALAFNVAAAIPGTDPELQQQWIVIGAHFDHLGVTGYGALDERTATQPHLGADDNASGTAAVLELALRLANSPMRRPVLLVHFGAEELGLYGSKAFVLNAPAPADSMVAMFNFDMIGQLRSRRLQLRALESARDWDRVVDSVRADGRLAVERVRDPDPMRAQSDHLSFALMGVPVMHFFTGTHGAYHTRNDTVDRLDVDGILAVIDYAERVIRRVGDGVRVPTRVPAVTPRQRVRR